MSETAQKICKTLTDAGYTAYFAGGWVRDLLRGAETDEIDIATSAPPTVIQELFPKTIPVGISFGVVIVVSEGVNFEVTTFRRDHPYQDGRHPEGIDFSTAEMDAQRRDFTINGMFYDPVTKRVLDYVNGREDLQKGIIRAIGNPQERFAEDRLRMIRAVRFASRLGFRIEQKTTDAIITHAHTLFPSVSIERVWQEFCKMAQYPHFDKAILLLHQLGLLPIIFPQLKELPLSEIEHRVHSFTHFPPNTPTIAYLLELFPKASLEEKLQLCIYLKTSLQEQKLVEFFSSSEAFFKREQKELYEWAHFFAHPLASLFIGIKAAKIVTPERAHFLDEQNKRHKQLEKQIERIKNNRPLLSAADLTQAGIAPGKLMGLLLKEGERLAINQACASPSEVLDLLRHSPLWPHDL